MIAKTSTFSLLTTLLLAIPASAAEIRGVVVKADPTKSEFTIDGRGKGVRGALLTFQVNRDTQIRKGSEAGTMADLVPGHHVRVLYDDQAGTRLAIQVTVRPPLFSSTSPAPPTPSGSGLTGTLRRVALTDREIVVISPGAGGPEKETTLQVPEDSKITRDQKPIRFEDLKEGEVATVSPEKKDGKLVAGAIQVGAVAQPAPPRTGDDRIAKIRQVLKMVDLFLQYQQSK